MHLKHGARNGLVSIYFGALLSHERRWLPGIARMIGPRTDHGSIR